MVLEKGCANEVLNPVRYIYNFLATYSLFYLEKNIAEHSLDVLSNNICSKYKVANNMKEAELGIKLVCDFNLKYLS